MQFDDPSHSPRRGGAASGRGAGGGPGQPGVQPGNRARDQRAATAVTAGEASDLRRHPAAGQTLGSGDARTSGEARTHADARTHGDARTNGQTRTSGRARAAGSLRRSAIWAIVILAIIAVLFAVRVGTSELPAEALPASVRDLFTLGISVFIESLPFVILGTLLSIFVQLWLPPVVFERILPKWPPLRRAVMSLFGVFLPVCECGNVPLARGLMLRGFTVAESLTFLLAAPILNPVTILTTYQAFGWDNGILIGRIVGGFVIANLLGWLVSRHPAQHELLTPTFEAACSHGHDDAQGSRLRRSVVMFAEETSVMLPALAVGSLLAGAIQVGIPREVLVALGTNPLWSVLALMALAFVVSVCSNVDAFFVLSFGSTFMPGAVVAFLVFGAMIDIKMLALLRTTFTAATLVRVTAVIALCALVLGLVLNLIV